MQYSNESYFLAIKTTTDDPGKRLAIIGESLDDLLGDKDSALRLSPIIRIRQDNDIQNESLPSILEGSCWLLFINSFDTSAFDSHPLCHTIFFGTFGLFSVLALTSDEQEFLELKGIVQEKGLAFEEWLINQNTISGVAVYPPAPASEGKEAISNILGLEDLSIPSGVKESLHEFNCISLGILLRNTYLPVSMQNEINSILLRKSIAYSESLSKPLGANSFQRNLGRILKTNAALSRFSSQAISGISPIFETDSHFWSHSLLGVGSACIGLRKLVRFYERVVGNSYIPNRLRHLANENDLDGLPNLASSNGLQKFIDDGWMDKSKKTFVEPDQGIMHLVPYFSARDGYKSSNGAISAPLNSIEACNDLRWSLITMTHEISHILVRSALSVLIGDLDSDDNKETLLKTVSVFLNSKTNNLLDVARKLMLQGVHRIYLCDQGLKGAKYDTADDFVEVLRDYFDDINETTTHAFDFYNFYGGNTSQYVSELWMTWGVIPSISRRVKEYLIRTISAVSINHITDLDPVQDAIEEIVPELNKLKRHKPSSSFIESAIAMIDKTADRFSESDYSEIIAECEARIPLIVLVRAFLAFPDVAGEIQKDPLELQGEEYALTELECSGIVINNPHMFISRFTRDHKTSLSKSLWMYHSLLPE